MQCLGVRRGGGNTDCVTVFCNAAPYHAAMLLGIMLHVALHRVSMLLCIMLHTKHILIAEGICYNKHLDDMRHCRREVFIETDCDKLVCYNNGT